MEVSDLVNIVPAPLYSYIEESDLSILLHAPLARYIAMSDLFNIVHAPFARIVGASDLFNTLYCLHAKDVQCPIFFTYVTLRYTVCLAWYHVGFTARFILHYSLS